ncbi:MAG: GGDEF domain-containing protein [Polyangiales bacterium]
MKTLADLNAPQSPRKAAEPTAYRTSSPPGRAGSESAPPPTYDEPRRTKPSGIHRIGRASTPGTQAAIERNSRPSSAELAAANGADTGTFSPRESWFASTRAIAIVSVAAITTRWFVQSEWLCAAISVVPLGLLLWREQRAQWSLDAAALWLALAALDIMRPLEHATHGELRSALSLVVLGLVLMSLCWAYRGIQELSRRDPLTGLLNRRGFEELARIELKRAARYGRPITFALLDVDRFKEVNDQCGHAAGDRVLQLVAAELRALRHCDLAVRLGGDEFGLLMPETDTTGAELLVARLLQSIQERMDEAGWPVTLSVGISALPPRVARLDLLMEDADCRMYEAKAGAYAHAR